MTEPTSKIIVIRLGALGDLILCGKGFQDIRRAHPDAEITLLTTAPFVPFARMMPWFDYILTDERAPLWRVGKWLELRRNLIAVAPTRVYDFQNKPRTERYFRLFPKNIRPEWSGKARGCSHPCPNFADRELHVQDMIAEQLRAAGVPDSGPVDWSWLSADIAAFNLPPRYAMIIPGCSPHLPHKRWPPLHYAELSKRLAKRGLPTVVVGTKADAQAVNAICDAAPDVIDLSGKTNLAELATVARNAAVVIGNDTGPMFLAAQVGAPTLALLSYHTDPVRSSPRGPKTAWIKRYDLVTLSVSKVEEALISKNLLTVE